MEGRMEVEVEESHVAMPHLDKTRLVLHEGDGTSRIISRWALIQEELLSLKDYIITSKEIQEDGYTLFHAVEDCITNYNPGMLCNFGILEDILSDPNTQKDDTLESVILFIIDCTLAIEELFDKPIQLLSGQSSVELLKLSKDQVCSILGNAFFCTFPNRGNDRTKYLEYPRINFTELYDDARNTPGSGWRARLRQSKAEKLKCMFNYFDKMKDRFRRYPNSYINYERKSLSQEKIPRWKTVRREFAPLNICLEGGIEQGVGTLQVDFANKFVGGGTLGDGAVMEEIKFSCCPELLAAQLFTKVFGKRDTLVVHNFEQFSCYTGYASTFQFAGSFEDNNISGNHIACVDAHQYPRNSLDMQVERRWVDRELNKCVSAFHTSTLTETDECSSVSSGKWGCGVFNGDPLLKSLIQWMATSHCNKSLNLYLLGDTKLSSELTCLKEIFQQRRTPVGAVYSLILEYGRREIYYEQTLSGFIAESLSKKNSGHSSIVHHESRENHGKPSWLRWFVSKCCFQRFIYYLVGFLFNLMEPYLPQFLTRYITGKSKNPVENVHYNDECSSTDSQDD